jgi:hypothetical protein
MTPKNILSGLLSVIAISSMLSFSACKKEEDDDHDHTTADTVKPALSISSPTDMKVYYSGDTVWIKGSVSDASLHELLIKITKDSDGSVLFSEAPVVHDMTSYAINTFWKSQVSDHSNAKVIVLAEDHSGNVSSDTVRIHIMP